MSDMTREEAEKWLEGMKKGYMPWSDEVLNAVLDMAISALSADVRPNIHGHWDFIGDNCFKCTACKEVKTYNEIMNSNGERAKFCPECGAIMDGEPKGEKGTE